MKVITCRSDCRNEFDPSYKVQEVGTGRKSSITDGRRSITRGEVRKLHGGVLGRNQNKYLSFGLFFLQFAKGRFCEG